MGQYIQVGRYNQGGVILRCLWYMYAGCFLRVVSEQSVSFAVTAEIGVKDGGYIHHLILCKGYLWKKSHTTGGVTGSLQYRKRYFELSNISLTYGQNEKKTGVSGGREFLK